MIHRRGATSFTLLVAGLLLLAALPAWATHYPTGAGIDCYDCHALSASTPVVSGVNSTSLRTSRLTTTTGQTTWTAGTPLPCVFCHYEATPGSRADMVDVKTRIGTMAQGHWGLAGGLKTSYLLSSTASAPSTVAASGLQCSNCHQITKASYVNHADVGNTVHGINASTQEPENAWAGAHFMLGSGARAVLDADLGSTAAANDLCDKECHAATSNQTITGLTKRAHALTEPDGGAFLTSNNCRRCHDAHATNAAMGAGDQHLYVDGAQRSSTTTVATPEASGVAYSVTDCLNLCHNKGAGTDYKLYGHGLATSKGIGTANGMNLQCSGCHDATLLHTPTGDTKTKNRLKGTVTDALDYNCLTQGCHNAPGTATAINHMRTTGTTFKRACTDCHEQHGTGVGATNTYMVLSTINGVTGIVFDDTKVSSATPGMGTNGHYDFGYSAATVCRACHSALVTTQHSTAKDNTNCVGCHSHKNPSDANNVNNPNGSNEGFVDPVAGTPPTYVCGDCHLIPPSSGAHAVHVAVGGTAADYTDCEQCHTNNGGLGYTTTVPSGTHGDRAGTTTYGTQKITFVAGLGYNNAATVTLATDVNDDYCATNTCHRGNQINQKWGDTTLDCDACHYYAVDPVSTNNTGAYAITGSHNAHFAATPSTNSADCAFCHGTLPVAGDTTHATATGANDGAKLLNKGQATQDEATLVANATWLPAGSFTDADPGNPLCTNDICHDTNNTGLTATWGTANASCGFCHPATPTSGSHTAHLTGTGYVCADCHTDNTGNYDHMLESATAKPSVQMKTAFTYNGTLTAPYGGTFGTCYNAAAPAGTCHTYNTLANNPLWGAATDDCSTKCHINTADVNNFAGNDKAISIISSTESAAASPAGGHGNATRNVTCAGCHDTTGTNAHDFTAGLTGVNPFRLKDIDSGTAGNQFSCSFNNAACHPSTKTGPRTGLVLSTIQTHSDAVLVAAGYATKRTWPAWDPQCVNCHDPHGDGSNYSMIQKELYDKAAFTLPVWVSQTLPAQPTEQTALTFTNDSLGEGDNSFAWGVSAALVNYSGVCQECHEAANHVSYKDGNESTAGTLASTGHPASNPGDCTGCHKHDTGFKPSGCNSGGPSCHGNSTNKNYWPDSGTTTADTLTNANEQGAHVKHITVLARRLFNQDLATLQAGAAANQLTVCEFCHQAVTNDADHGSLASLPADAFQGTYRKYMSGTVGAADADATYNTGTHNCTLTNCHNSKDTSLTTSSWYSGTVISSTATCLPCHTADGSAQNPGSGVHRVPSTTGVAHDDSFGPQPTNSGFGCATCHNAVPAVITVQTAAHINGTFTANDFSAATNEYYVNQTTMYTEGTTLTGATAGYCSGTGAYAANCHDGAGENTATTVWKRRWTSNSNLTTSAACEGCHGGFSSGDWTFGVSTGRTSDGNVDHNFDYNADATYSIIASHSGTTAPTKTCDLCHVYQHTAYPNNATTTTIGWYQNAANSSTYHGDGAIEMNSTLGYNTGTWLCGTNCHGASNWAMENSGWTKTLLAGAGAACDGDSCHGAGAGTLAVVWPAGNATGKTTTFGSHLKALTADSLTTATNWDVQCKKCHGMHSGTVTIPLPPANWSTNYGNSQNMQTILGLNYTSHNAIYIGGTSTTGTTEAEICWNCHSAAANGGVAAGPNEFGVNNNANTGSITYNYGSLGTAMNWTSATWTSAQSGTPSFSYKTRAIESTHSANFTGGQAGVTGAAYAMVETCDAVANIRCTYCHDVHDMNRAAGATGYGVADAVSGNPYLRGTYLGNPYKEDGAPQSGGPYTRTAIWGAVPRASTANTVMGGFWIDQNSGTPTSSWTSTQFGGLCFLCHGNNISTMDWKTGESLWIGTANGHANSVKNSGSSTGNNVYDARGGAAGNVNPLAHYQGKASPYGFRVNNASGYRLQPYIQSSSEPVYYKRDEWGVDEYGTATQANYHTFSCSKCHNPHASNMPKLMTVNCLDTKHNTWDNNYAVAPASGANSLNSSRSLSNWGSAQNCHRLGGDDTADARDVAGAGSGWNKVTPW